MIYKEQLHSQMFEIRNLYAQNEEKYQKEVNIFKMMISVFNSK